MGKRYGPEDIERGLEALAETGGNTTQASEKTGIPRGTLRYWAANGFASEFASIRQEKRSSLIEKVWATAERALDLLVDALAVGEDGKNPKIGPRELATVVGILTDKGLLLGGEPTEIMKQLPQMVFRGVDPSEYEEREQE